MQKRLNKSKPKRQRQYGLHCQFCHQDIYSNFRHDFQWCACQQDEKTRTQAIAIDGGWDYRKIIYSHQSKYKSISRFVTRFAVKR